MPSCSPIRPGHNAEHSLLWQASTVSRALAVAAGHVLQSSTGLDICCNCHHDWQQARLDSKLLLQWASLMTGCLRLDMSSSRLSGLSAFVEASRLDDVDLACGSLIAAAAQEGLLLPFSFSAASSVSTAGSGTFHCFPYSSKLHMEIVENSASYHPLMPSTLIHCFARQNGCLEELSLVFQVRHVELVCPSILPALEVTLEFTLEDDTMVNLDWLQRQPCSVLSVIVTVKTVLPTQHQQVTSQLLQLPLHRLRLSWQAASFPETIQLMWQQLQIRDHFNLVICKAPELAVLQALPSCPDICIGSCTHMDLNWAAVTSQPAQISLYMRHASLRILGGCRVPADLQGGWQLIIYATSCVHGLQEAQVQGAPVALFLQNEAAVSAGWKSY